MKKILSMLMLLVMLLTLCVGAAAENTPAGQVQNANPSVLHYGVTGNPVSSNDAVVTVEKTATPTGTENVFDVELKISTMQDIREISSDTPDAATLLILDLSGSMDYCVECGATSYHRTYGYGHAYKSRLTEAKERANAFIDEFATLSVQEGDKRYLAIVSFSSNAARRLDWVDVTDEAQRRAAKQIVNNLNADGGTNFEAGLMLGANVWNHASVNDIDHKYTILLSDGEPTFYVSDGNSSTTNRESITGSRGGGNYTTQNDAKDVGKQADRILGLGSLSKLYSICMGDVADDTPFEYWPQADPATTSSMTVLEWMEAFSTQAFEAEDATGLFNSFNSIISQIQLAAQAWKVDDVMGEHVVFGGEVDQSHFNKFTFENGTLHWDVLGSNPSAITQYDNGSVRLDYSLKYKVTLDNLDTAYQGGYTPTNNIAELTYAVFNDTTDLWEQVENPAVFPQPKVQGYEADLTFRKVYLDGSTEKPASGMVFKLESVENAATGTTWGPKTVTSDANGNVTFEDIPSGHNYILKEMNAGDQGFAAPGDIPVSVAWGAATSTKIVGNKLMNVKSTLSVSLKLEKAFEGAVPPALSVVTMDVRGPENYHRTVTLNKDNNWTMMLTGLTPGAYTVTEIAAVDGYNLTAEAEFGKLNPNGDMQNAQGMIVNGNSVQVDLTLDGNQSHQAYGVRFTNEYTRKVGGPVTIKKTFSERTQASMGGTPVTTPIQDSTLYAGIVVSIDFINAKGETERDVTLKQSNNWNVTIDELPIGTYTIEETIAGVMPDHDFVHMHLLVNGEPVTGDTVTIEENTSIELVMDNHYLHHMGTIHVEKLFEGVDVSLIPSDKVFYVDVYENNAQGKWVTEIEVSQSEVGTWVGYSEPIKVGQYYLTERTADNNVNGYTFTGYAFDDQVVTVENGTAPAYVTLTNTYEKDVATLTISKEFVGLPDNKMPEYINVNVIRRSDNGVETTVELRRNSTPAWTTTVSLPVGEYYLDEVTAVGRPGTADVADYGHTLAWTPSANVNLTKNASVAAKVTNTYEQNYGKLTVEKKFSFSGMTENESLQKAAELGLNITFLVQDQSGNTVDSILLNSNVGWKKTVDLPNGTYKLVERGARLDASTGYTLESVTINGQTLAGDAAGTTGYEIKIEGTDTQHDTVTVNATNNYSRDTGSLTIKKDFGLNSELKKEYFERANRSIDVLVYQNGAVVGNPVTLNAANGWSATLPNLPTGRYTLVEVHTEGETNTAYVSEYNLTYSWGEGAVVEMTKDAAIEKTVTNTYTRKVGRLAIYKHFIDLPQNLWPQSIAVKVMQGTDEVGTVTLTAPEYRKEVTLPIGDYKLVEVESPVGGYTVLTPTFKVDYIAKHTDTEVTAESVSVTVDEGTTPNVQVYLANKYEKDVAELTIKKEFKGLENNQDKIPDMIRVNVLRRSDDGVETTVELRKDSNPAWETTVTLPVGEYYLDEVTAAGRPGTADVPDYGHTYSWDPSAHVDLTKNATVTAKVTNTYTAHYGILTVSKAFDFAGLTGNAALQKAGELGLSITFLVQKKNDQGQYVTVDSILLNKDVGWTKTVDLTDGTYRLVERGAKTDLADYTFGSLTAVVESDGQKTTHDLLGDDAGLKGFEVVVNGDTQRHDTVTVNATNKYTRNTGSLKIEKDFAVNHADTEAAKNLLGDIDVQVMQGNTVVATVTLEKAKNWKADPITLPTGSYTLREVTAQGAQHSAHVEGYNLMHSWNGGAQVEVVKSTGVIKTVTNTYSRKVGQLAITKHFEDLPQNLRPQSITVKVMQGNNEVRTIELIAAENYHKVETLPIGAYTLVETDSAKVDNYTVTPTFEVNGVKTKEVTVKEGTTPSVFVHLTNNYSQHMGYIQVKKTFANDDPTKTAAEKLGKIDILVKDHQGKVVDTLTLAKDNVPDAWTATSKALPVGDYTLEEVVQANKTNTAFVEHYTVIPKWNITNPVEVTNGTTVAATVENTYTQNTGDVIVRKTVVSDYASDKQKEFSFKMELVGAAISGQYGDMNFSGGVATFKLADGKEMKATGLPAGVMCVVTEETAEGFTTAVNAVATQSAQNQIIGSATGVFTFVNTRVSDKELTISKTVDSVLRSDYAKEFTFVVKLDDSSAKGSFNAALAVGGVQKETSVTFADGMATVALKHGEAITIKGLPVGMGFTVTEAQAQGFAAQQPVAGVLGTDLVAAFVNTNAAPKAALVVSKTVEGTHASEDDVFTFEVNIPDLVDGVYGDMTFAGGKATVQLKHGQKAAAKGIPAGVTYTVTEIDYGSYTPNVLVFQGTMDADGEEAAFVNTLTIPELPETGDHSKLLLWGALLVLAGVGIVYMKRKRV